VRMANSRTQVESVEVAVTRMICDEPFFASLLLQYPLIPDDKIPTACVDAFGQIRYNPTWLNAMTVPEIIFVLAHECMHYMYMHIVRCFGRDPWGWNVACDAVINETLKKAGVGTMPQDGIELDGADAKTPEQVYQDMPIKKPPSGGQGQGDGQGGGGQGQGQGQGGGQGQGNQPNQPTGKLESIGEDMDDSGTKEMSPAEKDALEQEVTQRVLQARNAAKQVGNMPQILDDFVDSLVAVKTPWYSLLRPYFSSFAKNDFSYDQCDRRFIGRGIYLPTETGSGAGRIVWVNDESGSIGKDEMELAAAHLNEILDDVRPKQFTVLHVSTRVHEIVDDYEPEDYPITLHSRVTGGTDMTAGVKYAAEHYADAECIVVFTDGYTPFGDANDACGIPVIWCITTNKESPWGETIHVDFDA
jgi:predicted metal-dependent peptidase